MIGRLLALVGVVMMGFGIFGIYRSSQAIAGLNLGNTMQLATDAKAREAELCKPGETLKESKGASQYTQGQGYSSSVTLYCVNSEGQERDVTGEFGNRMVESGRRDIFDNILPNLTGSTMYFGLIGSRCGTDDHRLDSRSPSFPSSFIWCPRGQVQPGFTTSTLIRRVQVAAIDLNQVIQQARDMKASSSTDLSTRLKQLEDARNAGLISQTNMIARANKFWIRSNNDLYK